MSSLANWTYVYDLTVWPVLTDELGQLSYGTPYLLKVDWQLGGQPQTDKNGVQFVPKSTFYFEREEGADPFPALDDYVARGDQRSAAKPPLDAERIKAFTGWGMAAFGASELPDWRITT